MFCWLFRRFVVLRLLGGGHIASSLSVLLPRRVEHAIHRPWANGCSVHAVIVDDHKGELRAAIGLGGDVLIKEGMVCCSRCHLLQPVVVLGRCLTVNVANCTVLVGCVRQEELDLGSLLDSRIGAHDTRSTQLLQATMLEVLLGLLVKVDPVTEDTKRERDALLGNCAGDLVLMGGKGGPDEGGSVFGDA